MSERAAEHCGHDCCEHPHMPFHDHFLDPDDCPLCRRQREREQELRERAQALADEIEAEK